MIEKMRQSGGWLLWTVLLMLVLFFFLVDAGNYNTPRRALRSNNISRRQHKDGVKILTDTPNRVVLDNGLVQVTFSNPGGDVVGIKYNGIDNLLEINNEETNRGYWDVVWSNPGKKFVFDKLHGTEFKVVTAREDQAEVSFIKTYNVSSPKGSSVPLNVDKRYIMQRGSSGFYVRIRHFRAH